MGVAGQYGYGHQPGGRSRRRHLDGSSGGTHVVYLWHSQEPQAGKRSAGQTAPARTREHQLQVQGRIVCLAVEVRGPLIAIPQA
jgi:hypothetical protein